MRIRTGQRLALAVIAPLALLAAVPASAAPRAASTSTATATVRIFVAPVTATGHPATGFTIAAKHDYEVDCAPASASPVSISPNVEECSPSAAYAVACWKSATPHQVLCLEDPTEHKLTAAKLMGRFAPTKAASKQQLSPFEIVLADGRTCSIRDGGAWGYLKDHPNYYGTYACSKNSVVWARANAPHYGVDESTSSWTVQTGPPGGKGNLTTTQVTKAYFVATATS